MREGQSCTGSNLAGKCQLEIFTSFYTHIKSASKKVFHLKLEDNTLEVGEGCKKRIELILKSMAGHSSKKDWEAGVRGGGEKDAWL